MSSLEIILEFREGLVGGLLVTLKLCLIVWSSGLTLGSILGIAASRYARLVGYPVRGAAFLLSGVPVLVLLFWLHYPLQAMLGIVVDPFYTSAAAFAILNTFFVAGIVRESLCTFPQEYIAAARVCGLSSPKIVFRIQLPIILRQIIPPVLMTQVNMLQLTLFASLIAVPEIFRVAQRINAEVYRPIQVYSSLAIFFLAICLPLNGLALWLKSRFTRDFSER